MGNLRSVEKALASVGADPRRVTAPESLADLSAVLLPGVGSFGDCAARLTQAGLWGPLREWIAGGNPFLGICLGYQLLFEGSAESPGATGLGIIPGEVVRFPARVGKVPQIGWNTVRILRPSPFTQGIRSGDFVYFVHSYFPVPEDPEWVALETDYGVPFASGVCRGMLFAVQFHPEKSQRVGLRLLANFVDVAARRETAAPANP
ncbi:Imidazole glycerol phosphate synthase subunit HisH [Methylacidimicrobium sp. AP8]|uniref:imidazole glycerol phosphate synthase subunit HisH n=1 Tax=Methylacidimicrobium sp. AP8 TaxID=2730359 RepID=UPI0018C1829E|nr:imidazole glycerol phosphate synthase subunit HisH [Methylacidimicrobium sp. AP8]CAB4244353.1 Imidazole glycerol phosphate synthase subunit HisH [Methylacidimicrobium sp. AP8]